MYALTQLAARARIKQQQQQQQHLQAIDICSKHAEPWDTPDLPGDRRASKLEIKVSKIELN